MRKWKDQEVLDTIGQLEPVESVASAGPPEDYTTTQITARIKGSQHAVWIRGFVTNGVPLEPKDDVEVELVEVSSGFSDGGKPHDPTFILGHAAIQAALVKLGFDVVDSIDGYF